MGGSSSTQKQVYKKAPKDYFGEYKEGKYYVTNPWEEKPIILAPKGPGAQKPETIFEVLEKVVKADPKAKIFAKEFKNAEDKYEWKDVSRGELLDNSRRVARAFIKLGLENWEGVCIMGFNAPRWVFSYLGSMYAGGLACGIYTTNNPGQCEYIVNHCKARIAVLENKKQLDKFLKIRDNCEGLKYIVLYNDKVPDGANVDGKAKVITWDELLKEGDDEKLDAEIDDRTSKIKPGQCCSLIYTSGTTGKPKGVMMSHDNLLYSAAALLASTPNINWNDEQRLISYLPLSHVAAQFLDIICIIYVSYGQDGGAKGKACTYFCRPDALKGSIKLTLADVRPTIFMGVPRVWEKLEERIKAIGKQNSGLKKKISAWARGIGGSNTKNHKIGGNGKVPGGFGMANKLVFTTAKDGLGLDKCHLYVTAAAPIKQSTLDFFGSLDINITQAYGASESGGTHTIGLPYHDKYGSIGVVITGNEIKIEHDPKRDKKGEGELLLRGRNIMNGYLFDDTKSKKTINNLGYYMSGDVGRVDDNGLYYITGRIKELIITAGGENIAPVPIEDYIKGELEAVSNIVLIGEQQKYLTILVTLKCKQDLDTQIFSNELVGTAKEVDSECKTVDDARKSEKWKKYIEGGMKKYNSDTNACASNAQRVQYFSILDGDFSIPGGELTGTMKLKRSVIRTNYKQAIADLYDPTKLPKKSAKKPDDKAKKDDKKVEEDPEKKSDDKPKDEPKKDDEQKKDDDKPKDDEQKKDDDEPKKDDDNNDNANDAYKDEPEKDANNNDGDGDGNPNDDAGNNDE